MPRTQKVDRPMKLKISLPTSVYTRMMVKLWSPLEGTVPHGAISLYIEQLVRADLDSVPAPTESMG